MSSHAGMIVRKGEADRSPLGGTEVAVVRHGLKAGIGGKEVVPKCLDVSGGGRGVRFFQ